MSIVGVNYTSERVNENIEENKMNIWQNIIVNKNKIRHHLLFFFTYYLFTVLWNATDFSIITFIDLLLTVSIWASTFYTYHFYVIPKFFRNKNWIFLICTFFVLFAIYLLVYFAEESFVSFLKNKPMVIPALSFFRYGSFWYVNFALIALGYHFYGESLREKEQKLQAEIELQKTKLELKNSQLDSLKAQFNPHFLFNTLWYIYALVQDTGSKNATKAVELLSDMMRYSMKDYAVGSLAPLEDELKYVNNYVELQQLRTPMMKLDYQVEGDIEGIKILPLVLMSFVENAFKHGKLNESENPLIIHLTAVQGDYIRFFVKNKISLLGKERSNEIGLENVKKRLQSNYPNKHTLNITNQNQLYSSELIVKIPHHDNLHNS